MRCPKIRCMFTTTCLISLLFTYTVSVHGQEPDTGTQTTSPDKGLQMREPEDTPLLREKWFHNQRAFPLEHIPGGARLKALKDLERMLSAEAEARARIATETSGLAETAAAAGPLSPSSTQWTPIGPMPAGFWNSTALGGSAGRTTSLAVDPRNSKVVYAGAAGGGVWKTTDGGTTWTALTDSQPTLATGALTLDPTNPDIVYVGTGEANSSGDSYYGAGILKSTDGGATWTQTAAPFVGPSGYGESFASIAVHPTNGQILLAGNYAGVYRSTDAGATWTGVLLGGTGYSVLFDPTNGNTVYAALGAIFGSSANGIYKSSDAGKTWTRLNGSGSNVLPTTNLGRIRLAMDPSSSSTLYASLSNCCQPFGGIIGIYKTTDGGTNWTRIGNPPSCCDWYGSVLAVHPLNPNILFAGAGALYRSTDAGQTWSNFGGVNQSPSLHPDMHALAFSADGSVLYVANDGGVFSTAGSANPTTFAWNDLNATFSTITFYPGMSIDPTNASNTYGGTQDNGTEHYTGSPAWNWVACGDGGTTLIDPSKPTTVYVGCVGIDIEKSLNGVSFANGFITGINTSDRYNFINTALALDAANPQRLYFGTQFVYQSTNGAGSWTAISPDLSNGKATVNWITVSPNNPDVVYAATGDGNLQVTMNATAGSGATWSNHNSGLPNRFITHVIVHPTDPATTYVTFSGFNASGNLPGHVFKTTNSGSSWADITSNLPDVPVNNLLVDPDVPNRLYVATDVGVFFTKDGGATWLTLVQGLPHVVVQDVELHHATRTLRAATHGRGMWDLSVPLAPAAANLSVASLIFSGQLVGSISASQAVTLSNGGDVALTISSIGVTGANASDFTETNNCGANLVSGASCTINVSFSPGAPSSRSAQLTIADSAAGSPQAVALSGTGLQAAVTLSASTQTFASQIVGTTSNSQSVSMSDSGNAALTVSSIKIGGSSAGDFTEADNCTPSLAAGAGCSINITFKPTVTGTRAATITITDNAPGSPHQIAVTGTATDFSLAAAAGASTTVTITAGQTATYNLSLSPINGFSGSISLGCSGAPRASNCSASPSPVNLSGNPTSVTVSVSTTARSVLPPYPILRYVQPIRVLQVIPLILTLLLLVANSRIQRLFRRYVWALPALLLFLIMVACGGGTSSPPPITGTPAGTYTLTVTATSGGATRTQQLTLTVQ